MRADWLIQKAIEMRAASSLMWFYDREQAGLLRVMSDDLLCAALGELDDD